MGCAMRFLGARPVREHYACRRDGVYDVAKGQAKNLRNVVMVKDMPATRTGQQMAASATKEYKQLRYDPSMLYITAQCDGLTIVLDHSKLGPRYTYHLHGSLRAPVLDKDQKKSGPEAEKFYYMIITMAGFGVVEVALMHSGSRIKKGNEGKIKYWFERLVELGIGSADDEEAVKKMVPFKVRSSCPCMLNQRRLTVQL